MQYRDKYKALLKKGHIKEKKAREFVNELLNQLYTLESDMRSLRHENQEIKNDPALMVFRQLFERIDNMERKIETLDVGSRVYGRRDDDEFH